METIKIISKPVVKQMQIDAAVAKQTLIKEGIAAASMDMKQLVDAIETTFAVTAVVSNEFSFETILVTAEEGTNLAKIFN